MADLMPGDGKPAGRCGRPYEAARAGASSSPREAPAPQTLHTLGAAFVGRCVNSFWFGPCAYTFRSHFDAGGPGSAGVPARPSDLFD